MSKRASREVERKRNSKTRQRNEEVECARERRIETEGKTEERKAENKSANVEQEGDGEKRGVEEMNSLVSVLFAVEELLCQIQLLPNRFTQDTES